MTRSPLVNVPELQALIARLERATGPDRELDNAIWALLGQPLPDDPAGWPPLYTASLDAAMTLLPKGEDWAEWSIGFGFIGGQARARIWIGDELSDGQKNVGATPAIALCIAALKARSAA